MTGFHWGKMYEHGASEKFSRMDKTYKIFNIQVIFALEGLIKEERALENKIERNRKCVCGLQQVVQDSLIPQ